LITNYIKIQKQPPKTTKTGLLFADYQLINSEFGREISFSKIDEEPNHSEIGGTKRTRIASKTDTEQYLETFYYEHDPKFTTNYDFKVAKILSNDMLLAYLMQEIERLNSNGISISSGFPSIKLTWLGSKTELMEQLYSWDSDNTFGDVPLTQLSDYIQNVFNVQLDKNLSRAFSEMKTRNVPTPFLDKLKAALLQRMGRKK
jgi:hypothetical protein